MGVLGLLCLGTLVIGGMDQTQEDILYDGDNVVDFLLGMARRGQYQLSCVSTKWEELYPFDFTYWRFYFAF